MVSLQFIPVRVDCVLHITQESNTFQSNLIVIIALGTSISLVSSTSLAFVSIFFKRLFHRLSNIVPKNTETKTDSVRQVCFSKPIIDFLSTKDHKK